MSIRKTALEALKTKFDGIDESVLSRVASTISKTAKTEEDALAKVEDMTLQGVINSYTDSRVSDASEKITKTFEEKYGVKNPDDGKKEGEEKAPDDAKGKEGTGADNDMPSWFKAFADAQQKTNETFLAKFQSMEAGKTAEERKATIEKLLDGAPEKMKKSILREFGRSQFKDDKDFDSWVEEITPDIEDATEAFKAQGGVSTPPKSGSAGAQGVVNPMVQARIAARQAETVTPAIQGLPVK